MPWRDDARSLLALTRAMGEALARTDLEAARALLAEREGTVHRFAQSARPHRGDGELEAALAELAAAERRIEANLTAALAETGAALGRLPTNNAAPGSPAPPSLPLDRRA